MTALRQMIVFFVLWWLIVLMAITVAAGLAAASPGASCVDVLSMEAEANMLDGWQQIEKQDLPGGGLAYVWGKGQVARVLLFAPEAAGMPPKGSMFKFVGTCEVKGQTVYVARAQLGGEKA